MTPLPEGYRFERMKRADIAPLIQAIQEWFPSVAVGAASCHLNKRFYLDKVVIDEESDKDVTALLIKKGNELVGMGSWECESAAKTLYARLDVIAPAHRGARMVVLAMEATRSSGRAGTRLRFLRAFSSARCAATLAAACKYPENEVIQ